MKRIAGYAVLALLTACRPDPGDSDYENQGPTLPTDGNPNGDPDVLPGPFPYQAGQRRLGVGFYEGGRSDDIAVDNATTHVYLYDNTVTIEPSPTRVEGKSADLVVHAGKAWLGFGVHWDAPRDLRTWKTLHVSLRSSDPGFASVKVGMNHADKSVQLDVEKYGYKNDGQWHHLAIPLTEFTAGGLQLNVVNAPFVLIAGSGAPADKLLLDNLYFTAE
ncbi:MAG TPA: putative glycoside hydrolase [Archangium sp.]|nr:putative glycoside hydrolase [Archangium sp.]